MQGTCCGSREPVAFAPKRLRTAAAVNLTEGSPPALRILAKRNLSEELAAPIA